MHINHRRPADNRRIRYPAHCDRFLRRDLLTTIVANILPVEAALPERGMR